jgi:hypothetical protein
MVQCGSCLVDRMEGSEICFVGHCPNARDCKTANPGKSKVGQVSDLGGKKSHRLPSKSWQINQNEKYTSSDVASVIKVRAVQGVTRLPVEN